MSSPVTLVATTFTPTSAPLSNTYGFRIYDGYSQRYDNNAKAPITDDMKLLEYARSIHCDDIKAMLDFVKEEHTGMEINCQWYDYDEIKDYL
jgi:hypothetical protein